MNAAGIDVSSRKSTVAVLRPFGEVVRLPFDVTHSTEGLASLAEQLKALDGETRVVLEHTGRYYEPVAKALHEAGLYGSTVDIASGGYTLPGTGVSAGVTISGAGADKTVLKTGSKNYAFTGDNVTIKDVTIDGRTVSEVDNDGAIQIMGSNAVLDNVTLVGGGTYTYGHTVRADVPENSVTTVKSSTISGAFRAIQIL